VRDLELPDRFVGAVAAPAGDWTILQWPIRKEDIARLFLKFNPGLL
jgi:hypothetical protein